MKSVFVLLSVVMVISTTWAQEPVSFEIDLQEKTPSVWVNRNIYYCAFSGEFASMGREILDCLPVDFRSVPEFRALSTYSPADRTRALSQPSSSIFTKIKTKDQDPDPELDEYEERRRARLAFQDRVDHMRRIHGDNHVIWDIGNGESYSHPVDDVLVSVGGVMGNDDDWGGTFRLSVGAYEVDYEHFDLGDRKQHNRLVFGAAAAHPVTYGDVAHHGTYLRMIDFEKNDRIGIRRDLKFLEFGYQRGFVLGGLTANGQIGIPVISEKHTVERVKNDRASRNQVVVARVNYVYRFSSCDSSIWDVRLFANGEFEHDIFTRGNGTNDPTVGRYEWNYEFGIGCDYAPIGATANLSYRSWGIEDRGGDYDHRDDGIFIEFIHNFGFRRTR